MHMGRVASGSGGVLIDWVHNCNIFAQRFFILLDQHDIIDTFTRADAWAVSNMLMLASLPYLIVTFDPNLTHAFRLYDKDAPYWPIVAGSVGQIFTMERCSPADLIVASGLTIEGCKKDSALVLSGDKGDVAHLLNRPVFMLDDKDLNVNLVIAKGVPGSGGALVRRGRLAKMEVPPELKGFVVRTSDDLLVCSQQWAATSPDVAANTEDKGKGEGKGKSKVKGKGKGRGKGKVKGSGGL